VCFNKSVLLFEVLVFKANLTFGAHPIVMSSGGQDTLENTSAKHKVKKTWQLQLKKKKICLTTENSEKYHVQCTLCTEVSKNDKL
jgi:hypothetical protein